MKRADGLRRVVVTGFGMVTPIGLDSNETWASMKQGKCGIGRIENFPLEDLYIHIAGEIKGFDPLKHVTSKRVQYGERYSWFAGRAAEEAWTMSGLPTPYNNPYRSCCIIGTGAGGYSTVETAYRDLFINNKRATHPLTLLRIIGSSASAHVGIEYGIKGPTFATCSACSTATHAIGIAYDYIRQGLVDVGVAGASEAVLTYGSMRTWQAMRVLSPDGCFPFSKRRNGTVLAEGSGILVLEEYEHAKRRGATILAELMGFGMSSDSKDMVNPDIDGPRSAMQFALDDAGLDPSEIDYLTLMAPRRRSMTSTRQTPSRTSLANTPTRWRSPRPNRCTAICWVRAAVSRLASASRPSTMAGCRRRSATPRAIPNVISTMCPTRAVR